jgi:hypothetical protein
MRSGFCAGKWWQASCPIQEGRQTLATARLVKLTLETRISMASIIPMTSHAPKISQNTLFNGALKSSHE